MIISSPYKTHLYHSLAKYLPTDFNLRLLSADLGYGGALPVLRAKRIWSLLSQQMIRELAVFKPDIVFTDYPAYSSWCAKVYSNLQHQNIPIVVWLLGDFWTEYAAWRSTTSFPQKVASPLYFFSWASGLDLSDRILAICQWLGRIVRVRYPSKNSSIFYQGVDPDLWFPQSRSTFEFKKPAVGILQDNNILVKVDALLWFSSVVKEMRDVNFYIAGGGPYTPLVQKQFSNLPNAHLLDRLSYPNDVRSFYNSIDVYALPSGMDCCPNTLMEAALCGRPVVASRIGGIPELIVEGETGWSIPNGSTDSWVARIREILDNPELASRTGSKGRKFVEESFSWTKQAARLVSILNEELASKDGAVASAS